MRKHTRNRTSLRSNREVGPAGSTEPTMPATPHAPSQRRPLGRPRPKARRGFRLSSGWAYAGVGVLIIAGIVGLVIYNNAQQNGHGGSQYPYQVGNPGPGSPAPAIKLTATDGSQFDLATWRGKTVLLYFEEGVGCQPCWDQLKDINSNFSQFQSLGVQQIVTITGDPMDAVRQKVSLEGIKTTVLSDPGLAASQGYSANQYGMMGTGADGHTFIVVGPDGMVKWRADYGGSPKYTMYVPVSNLVADMQQGLKPKG
jgi:peroxiredoxin